jgi:hypothetical protein
MNIYLLRCSMHLLLALVMLVWWYARFYVIYGVRFHGSDWYDKKLDHNVNCSINVITCFYTNTLYHKAILRCVLVV